MRSNMENVTAAFIVKIDYGVKDCDVCTPYKGVQLSSVNNNGSRYMVAGGIYNKNRGALMFEARSLEEAEQLKKNCSEGHAQIRQMLFKKESPVQSSL